MCQFETEQGEKREKDRLFAWSLGTFQNPMIKILRVIIFLSEHFPEIPLLENVRFSLF
jgi:hypothetical protein